MEPTLLLAVVLLRHAAGHQQLSHSRLYGHTELVLLGAEEDNTRTITYVSLVDRISNMLQTSCKLGPICYEI